MARLSKRSMSRKASRTLINQHHQLEKKLRQAVQKGDQQAEAAVAAEISILGGLDRYQQASLQGQSNDRGGDTSKVLLEWLPLSTLGGADSKARMLEVGALSTRNVCTSSGIFDMVHIDLNSQEPGILKQDFMARPLPRSEDEKFDVISLSLVLNYVPEPEERGRMLLRTTSFLRSPQTSVGAPISSDFTKDIPSLFVVLPRSCVDNSRYFTQGRFVELMTSVGYKLAQSKNTQKLAYSLWTRISNSQLVSFSKREINPGRNRNNFAITLASTQSENSIRP